MKKVIVFILLVGFIPVNILHVFSQYTYYGQTVPQRVILNITDTAYNSMAVTWRTTQECSKALVRYAKATGWKQFEDSLSTINALKERVILDNGDTVFHYSAKMRGLKPSTLYVYSVGDGKTWSEWNQFKTANNTNTSFSFIYLGDPQDNLREHCTRVFRQAYKGVPNAGFWLFVGDLVNRPQYDRLWDEFFYAGGAIFRSMPTTFIPGNHEHSSERPDKTQFREFTKLWRPHFTLPENGIKGQEERSFYFDYQGTRFVMLNSSENLDDQVKWMDGILAANKNKWTIVSLHHPVYAVSRNRDSKKIQELLIPVCDKYGVDLVLTGHDHAYARTPKMFAGTKVLPNAKGTVYMVSMSGPKVYELNKNLGDTATVAANRMMLYQVITVDNQKVVCNTHQADGTLFDSFEIKK